MNISFSFQLQACIEESHRFHISKIQVSYLFVSRLLGFIHFQIDLFQERFKIAFQMEEHVLI